VTPLLDNEGKEPFSIWFKKYAKTRMGFTVVSWAVGLSINLISILALSHINKSYELGVMVFTTFICKKLRSSIKLKFLLVAICSLITVFARYVDSERFPFSAYFQVGIIYFLSLCSIGLLAIDLSFTLQDRYQNDLDGIRKS
jgi:hypothetical protein